MSTKSKKNPKKGKKDIKTERLTKVEHTFYELTIADCERKINRLTHHLEFLETNNEETKEKIRSLNEDKTDKSADLSRELYAINETNNNLNEKILILNREYHQVKKHNDQIIFDLEEKYRAMHDQLACEIKILNGSINMLVDFSQDQTRFNLAKEEEEAHLKQKEQEYKDAVHAMERKIQNDREIMRKTVESTLLHVSEEFTRSSAMRHAAYTQRLIRENIALGKEISILDQSQQSMDQQRNDEIANHKKVKATFPALYQKKRDLILVAQQKTNQIEQLTAKCEHIKSAYVENLTYKHKYQSLMKYQLCSHYQRHQLCQEAKKLGTHAHDLKTECMILERRCNSNEKEIKHLVGITKLVRNIILKHINVIGEAPEMNELLKDDCSNDLQQDTFNQPANFEEVELEDEESLAEESDEGVEEEGFGFKDKETKEKSKNLNLLEELVTILQLYETHSSHSQSMGTISPESELLHRLDLMPSSTDSVREAFKFGGFEPQSSESSTDLAPLQQDSIMIPLEHLERGQIFDVEKGSTLYVSSIVSNPDLLQMVEETPGDDIDVSSQNYSSSSDEYAETKAAPVTQIAISKPSEEERLTLLAVSSIDALPPNTIFDVEMSGEAEEEAEDELSDNDIYRYERKSADEMDTAPDETDAIEEEEMSIYMFY